MVVRFYLKEPKKKESLIIARALWQNYQLPYSTKRKIETKYWVKENKKSEPVQKVMETTKYPKFSEVNQSLSNIRNDIEQVFIRFVNENKQQEPITKQQANSYDPACRGRLDKMYQPRRKHIAQCYAL